MDLKLLYTLKHSYVFSWNSEGIKKSNINGVKYRCRDREGGWKKQAKQSEKEQERNNERSKETE
jgi:hypothetical protein